MVDLTEIRARQPGRIAEAWANRARRPLLGDDGRLLIVAADHPARGALGVRDEPDGHGQPPRAAGPARDRGLPTRRGRRARHPGHPGRPAADGGSRRPRGHRLHEPGRHPGRDLRVRRPLHRLHRGRDRGTRPRGRQDAHPDLPRRPGHGRHAGGHRAGRHRARRAPADGHGRAVPLGARRWPGPQPARPRQHDQVDPHRPGSRGQQRVHLDEAAGGRRPRARHGRHDHADAAAGRRPDRRPGGHLCLVGQGPGAASPSADSSWAGPCCSRPTATSRRRSTSRAELVHGGE